MAIKIDPKKFKAHKCPAIEACPNAALSQKDENTPPVVDPAKCMDCLMCTTICTEGEFSAE